jgi:hypothetical protein
MIVLYGFVFFLVFAPILAVVTPAVMRQDVRRLMN